MAGVYDKYVEFITDRYKDKIVHVVASGPSLTGFDYSFFDNKNVIAVNHSYKLTKHDFVVFTDKSFPKTEDPEIIYKTTCLSIFNPLYTSIIPINLQQYFSLSPKMGVYCKGNSGVVALTIALQSAARKVYLHGFDFCGFDRGKLEKVLLTNGSQTPLDSNYALHSTDGVFEHRYKTAKHENLFTSKIRLFAQFPKGKIFNCSEFSAIPYFDKLNWWECDNS